MSHTKNKRYTIEIEMIGDDVGCRLNGIILSAKHASITMMNGHTIESNCEFINDDDDYCYYYYTRFVARIHTHTHTKYPSAIHIDAEKNRNKRN